MWGCRLCLALSVLIRTLDSRPRKDLVGSVFQWGSFVGALLPPVGIVGCGLGLGSRMCSAPGISGMGAFEYTSTCDSQCTTRHQLLMASCRVGGISGTHGPEALDGVLVGLLRVVGVLGVPGGRLLLEVQGVLGGTHSPASFLSLVTGLPL